MKTTTVNNRVLLGALIWLEKQELFKTPMIEHLSNKIWNTMLIFNERLIIFIIEPEPGSGRLGPAPAEPENGGSFFSQTCN